MSQWDSWVENNTAWLDELAALPEEQLRIEYSLMPKEMENRVRAYIESREK